MKKIATTIICVLLLVGVLALIIHVAVPANKIAPSAAEEQHEPIQPALSTPLARGQTLGAITINPYAMTADDMAAWITATLSAGDDETVELVDCADGLYIALESWDDGVALFVMCDSGGFVYAPVAVDFDGVLLPSGWSSVVTGDEFMVTPLANKSSLSFDEPVIVYSVSSAFSPLNGSVFGAVLDEQEVRPVVQELFFNYHAIDGIRVNLDADDTVLRNFVSADFNGSAINLLDGADSDGLSLLSTDTINILCVTKDDHHHLLWAPAAVSYGGCEIPVGWSYLSVTEANDDVVMDVTPAGTGTVDMLFYASEVIEVSDRWTTDLCSVFSPINDVEIPVFNVQVDVTNGTNNASSFYGETDVYVVTDSISQFSSWFDIDVYPTEGYEMPDEISVTGAEYHISGNTVRLTNPSNDIYVSIKCSLVDNSQGDDGLLESTINTITVYVDYNPAELAYLVANTTVLSSSDPVPVVTWDNANMCGIYVVSLENTNLLLVNWDTTNNGYGLFWAPSALVHDGVNIPAGWSAVTYTDPLTPVCTALSENFSTRLSQSVTIGFVDSTLAASLMGTYIDLYFKN